jgi:hypothetical protein
MAVLLVPYSICQAFCHIAPSLTLLIPCRLLGVSLFLLFRGKELPEVAGSPTVLAHKLLVDSSSNWGCWPLHNIQSLIFHSLMENAIPRFKTPSPRVCLTGLLNILLLPRCSCSFRPQLHTSSLHSGPFHHLFVTALLCSADMTWQGNHPWAAANFCWDTPPLWVHFFSFRWHPLAICQFPYLSISAVIVSTLTYSLGTTQCFVTVSTSFEFAAFFFRQVPTSSQQAFISFWSASVLTFPCSRQASVTSR